jgi:deoxyribodipyrimidine photo-lyase
MQKAAAAKVAVRMEAVDSNGLLPMSVAAGRPFHTAYSFRRFLQQKLPSELARLPEQEPLAGVELPRLGALPAELKRRWPALRDQDFARLDRVLSSLAIDHGVGRVAGVQGGHAQAQCVMTDFVELRLPQYSAGRNHPDASASSGLSPWLHFGHISSYDLVQALKKAEHWDGLPRGARRDGRREGFWGLSENAEAFLDELVTWRELGVNACATMPDYDRYESLPAWARSTLEAHERDPRERVYTLAQLEQAETADAVWNAAQSQLVSEGRIHNYLRMLWGKKVLEWTRSPREALERLIHLNNKYALDGRDPSSYCGIFWVFGRYDRPWAPERPIFGTVRYMSSASAQRKLRMRQYMEQYGGKQSALFVST